MTEDRHAITGYAFLINGGAMSWSPKKQEIVLLWMTEGKYLAATHAAKEVIWLQALISQLFGQAVNQDSGPTMLFSDNKSAITLSQNP
jgi:hypothetical protein